MALQFFNGIINSSLYHIYIDCGLLNFTLVAADMRPETAIARVYEADE